MDKLDILKKFSFYRETSSSSQSEFERAAGVISLPINAVVFHEGDICSQIALIGAGRVRIFKTGAQITRDQLEQRVHQLKQKYPKFRTMKEFELFIDAERMRRVFQQRLPEFSQGNLAITDCQILRTRYKTYWRHRSGAVGCIQRLLNLADGAARVV